MLPSALAVMLLGSVVGMLPVAQAQQEYKSRLGNLLLKKNNLYMPSRLVLGEEVRFVVKAMPGYQVKVFLSSKGEGYTLPDGTPLNIGTDVQELSGTVPENGVLELKMNMPKDPELEGKQLYVAAVAGPSEQALAPVDLVDATGRRTSENTLAIVRPAERGGPNVMPNMPGLSPQLFNQLTTLSEIYGKNDSHKKELLDNGDVNSDRDMDRNPFVRRGIQPGITGGQQ